MKAKYENCPEIQVKLKRGKTEQVIVKCSDDAHQFFKKVFDMGEIEWRESSFVVFTDRELKTIAYFMVSQGGISGTVIDPKIVFSTALKVGASGMFLAHNHPSGQLRPSEADKNLTKKMIDGGKLLDIVVHDHIIITANGYYSFADEGIL